MFENTVLEKPLSSSKVWSYYKLCEKTPTDYNITSLLENFVNGSELGEFPSRGGSDSIVISCSLIKA